MQRTLTLTADVSHMSDDQAAQYAFALEVQNEANEGEYPDVDKVEISFDPPLEPGPRTMLVHLNVEVPVGDERTADQIADAIEKALHAREELDRLAEETGDVDEDERAEVLSRLVIVSPLAEEV